MWPDLAKFRHFGKIFEVLGNFSGVYLLFGKIFSLLWHNLYTFGQIFIDVIGQNVGKQSCNLVTLAVDDGFPTLEDLSELFYCLKVKTKNLCPHHLYISW